MEILITLSFILLFISWISDSKRKYNPLVIFNGLWLFIYMLYFINLFDFFIKLDLSTYIILAVMQIGFTLGGLFGEKIKLKIKNSSESPSLNINTKWLLREKIFLIISIVAIVLTFMEEISIIIKLLQGVSFHSITAEAEGKTTVTFSGVLQVALHMFFLYPMAYVITPVCAVEIIYRKNKPMIFFIINVLMVTLSVVHHGGRNALFQMLLCYLLVFLISEKGKEIKLRTKILAVVLVIFSFALIINISESRGISDIGGSFYGYFTCCIPLSNQYLASDVAQRGQMWGLYSFKGFLGPAFTIMNYLGLSTPKLYLNAQDFAGLIEESYMYIGNNSPHTFNAFIPAGASLYVDGGYPFEFLIMFIYGWISGALFRRIKNLDIRNSRNFCLFIFFMIGVVFSFSRFWFSSYHYALAVIYIILLYHRKRESKLKITIN